MFRKQGDNQTEPREAQFAELRVTAEKCKAFLVETLLVQRRGLLRNTTFLSVEPAWQLRVSLALQGSSLFNRR